MLAYAPEKKDLEIIAVPTGRGVVGGMEVVGLVLYFLAFYLSDMFLHAGHMGWLFLSASF
jgi:hypothetical protein